jgi:hypothetical protein
MTVQYSSSRRELASWYWYSLRHNPRHLGAWLLSLLVLGVLVFFSELQSGSKSSLRAVGLSAVWVLAFAGVFALYPQLRFEPQVRTLTIEPDAISTSIRGRSKTYPWSEVASVLERGDCVYITFRNANAFVVPTRAFPSVEMRREFLRLCQEWQRVPRGRPAT